MHIFESKLKFEYYEKYIFMGLIQSAMNKWEQASQKVLKLVNVSPETRESQLNRNRVADVDLFFAHFDHGDSESEPLISLLQ